MYLINHEDLIWQKRVRRVNGALTYSKDLVAYQIPKWEERLGKDSIITTCAKFSEVKYEYDRTYFEHAIQYLHSYPYSNSIERVAEIKRNLPFKTERLIFMSCYNQYVRELNNYGIETIFTPMAIDVKEIQKHQFQQIHEDKIIYFGNVVQNKTSIFEKLKRECHSIGLKFDYISKGKFNDKIPVTQEEALKLASRYKYGIGVGRCAQELMALGVKTLIAGQKFGGLITNLEEEILQVETNMNGRLATYSQNIRTCLQNIDKAILVTRDIAKMNHSELI